MTGCGFSRPAFADAGCRPHATTCGCRRSAQAKQLLKAVQASAIDWKTFTKRYREELFLDGPIDDRSETIKNHGQKSTLRLFKALGEKQNVTLMCHCDEDATRVPPLSAC